MMRRVEPGHTEQTSATCSSVKIVNCVCFFLFHCCWFLSYFISFYGSNTCLFYVSNKLPFESKQLYVKVFFNLYLHHHLIIHSRMHRHARFIGIGLFPGVTFRASYYVFMSIRLHARPGVLILGGQKNDYVVLINVPLKIQCSVI